MWLDTFTKLQDFVSTTLAQQLLKCIFPLKWPELIAVSAEMYWLTQLWIIYATTVGAVNWFAGLRVREEHQTSVVHPLSHPHLWWELPWSWQLTGKAGIRRDVVGWTQGQKVFREASQASLSQRVKLTSKMSGAEPLFAALEIVNMT